MFSVDYMLESSSPIMDTSDERFQKAVELIKKSKYFNKNYYLENNPDIKERGIDPLVHYLFYGYEEGRNPSKYFNNDLYLEKYDDVKKAGINPLIHFILFGKYEGRVNLGGMTAKGDKYRKQVNFFIYLDKDHVAELAKKDLNYKDCWFKFEDSIKLIKQMDVNNVLEIFPYKTPLIKNSDVMDSTEDNVEYYPQGIGNFYLHNYWDIPFPFEDKRYDLVILNNDLRNLDERQLKDLFKEIERIGKKLLFNLKYKYPLKDDGKVFDEELIDSCIENNKLTYSSTRKTQIIRIYDFED